ncbi:hypothetical protein [Promicromonospora sp. AC04]|uniref:hypothetical protein n=1 Tax=Promicromonospora sp. AC04 TaxID=2135723 RepID=UPI0013050389|nr:hypothetical protein [Promicromonospora sp. AC04]
MTSPASSDRDIGSPEPDGDGMASRRDRNLSFVTPYLPQHLAQAPAGRPHLTGWTA